MRDAQDVEKGCPSWAAAARGDSSRAPARRRCPTRPGSVDKYLAFLSIGRLMTLFGLNFMWDASAPTASICCSVDCSSAQNSSAAASRRSADIFSTAVDGRNSLRSCIPESIVYDPAAATAADVSSLAGTTLQPALLRHVRVQLHGFPVRIPAASDRAVHILDLGGTTFASGLFLGFLTYSSSFSAPLTGAFVDRTGQRRVLIVTSIALAVFSIAYAVITDYRVMLALVLIHGVFWSGLLSASAAYMTGLLPESRRAEGIGYWGLSTLSAIAVAPTVGFWIYRAGGWLWLCAGATVLNVAMAAIAAALPEHQVVPSSSRPRRRAADRTSRAAHVSHACAVPRSDMAGSPASPRCMPTSMA